MNFFEELNNTLFETDKLPQFLREFIKTKKRIHSNRYKALDDLWHKHDFKKGLEIGRSAGYSAVAFAIFYPEATLDSIDIISKPQNAEFFEYMGVQDRINIITGDSSTNIPKGEFYDYIFIDGDHTYEGAKKDWEQIQLHVIPDVTCIIFDDIKHVWGPKVKSVSHLWNEIENDPCYKSKKICCNMGVIYA